MNITDSPKFVAVRKAYLASLKQELSDLKPAISRSDFETIRQFSHRTKGTAGTYTLSEISQRAGLLQIMAEAKEEQRLEDIYRELYDLVVEELQRF